MKFSAFVGGRVGAVSCEQIRDAICVADKNGWEIVLLTHEDPDYDAIASTLWLSALVLWWTKKLPTIFFDGECSRVERSIFCGKPLNELAQLFAAKQAKGEQLFVIACDCHNPRASNVCSSIDAAGIPLAQMSFDHHQVVNPECIRSGTQIVDQEVVAAGVLLVELMLAEFDSLANASLYVPAFGALAALALLGIITDAPDANLSQELGTIQIACPRGQAAIDALRPICDIGYYERLRQESRMLFDKGMEQAHKCLKRCEHKGHQVVVTYIGLVEPGFEYLVAQVADKLHDGGEAALVIAAGMTTKGELKFAFRNGTQQVANQIASLTLGTDSLGRPRGGGHSVKAGGVIRVASAFHQQFPPTEDNLYAIGLTLFRYYTGTVLKRTLGVVFK